MTRIPKPTADQLEQARNWALQALRFGWMNAAAARCLLALLAERKPLRAFYDEHARVDADAAAGVNVTDTLGAIDSAREAVEAYDAAEDVEVTGG